MKQEDCHPYLIAPTVLAQCKISRLFYNNKLLLFFSDQMPVLFDMPLGLREHGHKMPSRPAECDHTQKKDVESSCEDIQSKKQINQADQRSI